MFRILIAEDDSELSLMFQRFLTRNGFSVTTHLATKLKEFTKLQGLRFEEFKRKFKERYDEK